MRIIAGAAGSLRLQVPRSLTRPTTDRVREAVFSSLGDRVHGARVLDLFAGSGALGIEALSRGAAEAVFVDSSREAERAIRENLRRADLGPAHVHREEVRPFLRRRAADGGEDKRFSLLIADPPYAKSDEELAALSELLNDENLAARAEGDALFVLETLADRPLPESPLWETIREKTYGRTRVSYLAPRPPSA